MKTYPKSRILALLMPVVLPSLQARAEILSNGSFESPLIAAGTTSDVAPTSWSWGGNPGFLFNGRVDPAVWPAPQQGQQFADIGNSPSMGLAQNFTIGTAGTYTLTWRDSCGLDTLIDNVSLRGATQGTPVPATIHRAVEVVWSTVPGTTYQVQSTLSLTNPTWTDLGPPVTGDGADKSAFDTTRDADKRFYRVIKLQ